MLAENVPLYVNYLDNASWRLLEVIQEVGTTWSKDAGPLPYIDTLIVASTHDDPSLRHV